jgi:ferrous iron transport protein B
MSKKTLRILAAVAGQPNSGKSTIFNCLTGARQHVLNYPGVTVEKKVGSYYVHGGEISLVDLPGTYSLTSYSMEERVARDFLLLEKPNVMVDVVDAANLERNLYLTFQLMEMGIPLVIDLNMMDVARKRGFQIDIKNLSRKLGVPVVSTVGNKGEGQRELKEVIWETSQNKDRRQTPMRVYYGEALESALGRIERMISRDPRLTEHFSPRWLAIKLMESDAEAQRLVQKNSQTAKEILEQLAGERKQFIARNGRTPEKVIAQLRYQAAEEIVEECVKRQKLGKRTLTDRIDQIVCHKIFGPIILFATIYAMYELAIVQGYNVTNYTWPMLAWLRNFTASLLPPEGFIFDPPMRAMPLAVIDGIIAVLNYVPIFLILFALIAILEDTGYMARMAFILDRIFVYFGLHGKSILPLVLGGLYVGGCAIPGVMACRSIKDERARMATIMIVPLMNCLAKIPLYVLLIGMFFAAYKGFAMFFMATITIIIALSVSKVLSLTFLRKRETAPFVMEMPAYHLPTIRGVLRRCFERTWLFIRKIITIVIAVMFVVFLLITLPGLSKQRHAYYVDQAEQATRSFYKEIGKDNPYIQSLSGGGLMSFVRYADDYKEAKMGVKGKEAKKALDQEFESRNPDYFKIVKRGKYTIEGRQVTDKAAKKVDRAYKKLAGTRKSLRRERKEDTVETSFMGRAGRFVEPFTKYAGFNWRVNIALLSSFAAKESSVATLGSIYEPTTGGQEEELGERIKGAEKGWSPLHALAIMLFMAMYPPCIPALLMVRLETGSTKWMLFAAFYPVVLGLAIAILVFTGGGILGLSGLEAMIAFYVLAVAVTTVMGLIKRKTGKGLEKGGGSNGLKLKES